MPYLQHHFPRYQFIKNKLLSHWARPENAKLLDIGAHWLHQSLLYAVDGFQVTAVDLPITLELSNVKSIAEKHAITLLPDPDLEHATALAALDDNTFDVVLFTEIIEHITFNPVGMWREIYRVMKPGGRIIITTPNYYAFRGRAWGWLRFVRGFGGGLGVIDVLGKHTYSHHWKEYSLRELIYYFCVLSPDFNCTHHSYAEEYHDHYAAKPGNKLIRWLERIVPVLRPDLYVEIEITSKSRGIVVEPRW